MSGSEGERPPVITIDGGNPSPAEVAAVVVALAALSSKPPDSATRPKPTSNNGWAARWRGLQTQPRPGPDAWRQAARPR